MATGFYSSGSYSGSYVANKRTDTGGYQYDVAETEVGLQEQAALQSLGKSYEETISNAYNSYLATQRSIGASAMGQGYKEAYKQAAIESLQSTVAETNTSAASARASIGESADEARETIQTAYDTEVANIDKVVTSLNNYLTYIKTLSGTSGTYLTSEQSAMNVDDLYDVLLEAQPQAYTDTNSVAGKSYIEWVKENTGTDEDSQTWLNWLLYQGGLNEFNTARTADPDYTEYAEEVAERTKLNEEMLSAGYYNLEEYQADLAEAQAEGYEYIQDYKADLELAKEQGYDNLDDWRAAVQKQAEEAQKQAKINSGIKAIEGGYSYQRTGYGTYILTASDGSRYKLGGGNFVTMDSPTSKNILNAIGTPQEGKVYEYNGKYYICRDTAKSWGRYRASFIQVDFDKTA